MKITGIALALITGLAIALAPNASAAAPANASPADTDAIQKVLASAAASPIPKDAAAHHADLAALAGKVSGEPLRKQLLAALPDIEAAAAHSEGVHAIAADLKAIGGIAEITPGGPAWLRDIAGADAMHIFDQLTSFDVADKQSPHNKDYHLLTNFTDESLAKLEGMTELKNLSIANTNVKGPGLKYLAGLIHLENLNLTLCPTTDEYLKPLANLSEMKRFGLASAKCDGTGFKYLGKMTKLENLNFHYTPVNDDGLREICRMTSLERLEIVHCHWTDSGAANLANLKNMQRLQLGSRQASGASVAFLKGLPKLKELDLHDLNDPAAALRNASELQTLTVLRVYLGGLKDDDFKNIAKLGNLEELVLGGTITEGGAAALADLKKLKKLSGAKMSPAVLEKLKAALPGLVVTP
jgi:hypothetical protein